MSRDYRDYKLLLAGIVLGVILSASFLELKTFFKKGRGFSPLLSNVTFDKDQKDRKISMATEEALKGEELYNQRKYFKSISHFRKAITFNPDFAEVYYKLGKILTQMERYEEAIEVHQKAIKLNFNESLTELALIYEHMGLYDKAMITRQEYKKAILLNPDSILKNKKSGKVSADIGETREYLSSKIESEEKAEASYKYGCKLEEMERYEEAIYMYKAAIKRKPDFYLAYYNLGVCYKRLGKYQAAIKSFEKCVFYQPEFVLAYKEMGWVYALLENKQSATHNLRRAALMFLMNNKRDKAIETILMLQILSPDSKISTEFMNFLGEKKKAQD